MFPDDKIIEIFSMCDDFSKNFDDIIQKNSIDARESTKNQAAERERESLVHCGDDGEKKLSLEATPNLSSAMGSPPATCTDVCFSRVDAIHFAIAQCIALTRVTKRSPSGCLSAIFCAVARLF